MVLSPFLSSLTFLHHMTLCNFSLLVFEAAWPFYQNLGPWLIAPHFFPHILVLILELKLNALFFIVRKKLSLWEKHQNQDSSLTSSLSLLSQGVFLFLLGMGINIHSDYILRQLRKPGEIIYKIPQGNISLPSRFPLSLGACPMDCAMSNKWRGDSEVTNDTTYPDLPLTSPPHPILPHNTFAFLICTWKSKRGPRALRKVQDHNTLKVGEMWGLGKCGNRLPPSCSK